MMKKQVYALLAGGALLAFASAANAGELRPLSDNQMDAVSAGQAAANAAGLGIGEAIAFSFSQVSTYTQTVGDLRIAVGQSYNQAIGAGGFLFNAGAVSHSDSAASLP
jgi:hypothetical protein